MLVERWVRGQWLVARRSALRCAMLFPALLGGANASPRARPLPPTTIALRVILVANGVRDSMNMVFLHSTSGWRKYPDIESGELRTRNADLARDDALPAREDLDGHTLDHGLGDAARRAGLRGGGDGRVRRQRGGGRELAHASVAGGQHAEADQDPRAVDRGSSRISRERGPHLLAQWDRDSIAGAVRAFNGSVQYPIPVLVEPNPAMADSGRKADSAVTP